MKLLTKNLILGACMLAAAGMAVAMKPVHKLVDKEKAVNLETLIPQHFGNWTQDEKVVQLLVTPELQKVIEETYSQTLSRTYVNAQGDRIMLSVAYGGTHGEGMQTHRPEICYPAQGFRVVHDTETSVLQTKLGPLQVRRLAAEQGPRHEPITYWVVVGSHQTGFGLGMKLAQMRYTLTGVIPDGMLVRVSSIGRDDQAAYAEQDDFMQAMLGAIKPADREHIFGQSS